MPALLEVRRSLVAFGEEFWAKEKLAAVDGLIAACLGLHMEAVTERPAAQPGETLNMQIEAINRSDVPVKFKTVRMLADGQPEPIDTDLKFEAALREEDAGQITGRRCRFRSRIGSAKAARRAPLPSPIRR